MIESKKQKETVSTGIEPLIRKVKKNIFFDALQ